MPILARLVRLYESRDIKIVSGLNPTHFDNFPAAPFTAFFRDGASVTNGLGIALQEIYFLECLFANFRPRALFAIGNSMGWSTLALGLLNPEGRILAIDAGLDRNSLQGIDFTNEVARQEGLPVEVVRGKSPDDVARLLGEHRMAPLDFVFVDGFHSVEQVERDFAAVRPHASADCVFLFHDVAEFRLQPGIEKITKQNGLAWDFLAATTSGMAIVYDPARRPPALDDIAPFIVPPTLLARIQEGAWRHHHRHLARWRRSLNKRLVKLGLADARSIER